jgi:hypothetical protein
LWFGTLIDHPCRLTSVFPSAPVTVSGIHGVDPPKYFHVSHPGGGAPVP